MAMSLLDEGSSPWEDPFIGVFDQSSDTFDIPNINWDLDLENLDEDSPVLATNIVRASTPPAPQEIFASGSPLAETPERPRRPKSKKGRKGRPKSTLEDGQSAVEVSLKAFIFIVTPLASPIGGLNPKSLTFSMNREEGLKFDWRNELTGTERRLQ